MQNKIFAAAAIAAATNALKLEAPTNSLAQASGDDCHGVYAYQCIEEKVKKSHESMAAQVEDLKLTCINTAEDQAEDIIENI